MHARPTVVLMAVALMALATPAAAQPKADAPPTAAAVAGAWAGEARYWDTNIAADVPGYLKLFHPRFTGWPCGKDRPSGKADLIAQGAGLLDAPGVKLKVTLEDKAATGGGGAVVVYYRARVEQRGADGTPVTVVRNFTHTWVHGAEGWQIVGGMCREDETRR